MSRGGLDGQSLLHIGASAFEVFEHQRRTHRGVGHSGDVLVTAAFCEVNGPLSPTNHRGGLTLVQMHKRLGSIRKRELAPVCQWLEK